MAETKIKYAAWSDITITLTSLASDSTLKAGRASTAVDNATNLYVDAFVAGKFKTGTAPTAGVIEVWSYAEFEGTPTYVDGITGTDANKTMTTADIKRSSLALLAVIPTDATQRTYYMKPRSLVTAYQGVMPRKWGIFVVHDTGAIFTTTTADYDVNYQGVTYTTA